MTTTLTFQNTPLEMVTHDGVIWISAPELAKALDYKRSDSISRIYDRNQDEFSPDMSMTVNLTVNGINGSTREKQTRIFSLRGAHLVAMFARSKVAKDFRKWVLNILDGVTAQESLPYYDTPAIEHKNKFCMDENDIMRLVWIWFAAEQMRQTLGWLEPPLRQLGSSFSGTAYSQHSEYERVARKARNALLPLVENIHCNMRDRDHVALRQLQLNFSNL